jgi:hypothetical protein
MRRGAFQYYVFAFAEFVVSDAAVGDPDSASPFLHLVWSFAICLLADIQLAQSGQ